MNSNRGEATAPGPVARLFGDAAALHQNGRLDEAARRYQAILLADASHFDALHLFGVLRAQQGQLAEAANLLRRAIECNPVSGPAHNNLGMTLNLLKRHEDAVAPLERAVALDRRNAVAHNNLGVALQALGRVQPAAACFERAVGLRPDYVEALNNFGAALQSLGRGDEAIPVLEKALALNPGFTDAALNLGAALHALDRQSEAMACFDRVLAADPRNVAVLGQIGAIHLETGRFADARACYERALEIEPGNARVLFDLVQCGKVRADDPHLAVLEGLARNPAALAEDHRIRLHFALGKAYGDLGRNEPAFQHLREGNALKRRRTVYNEGDDLRLFERIRTVFSADLVRRRASCGNPSDRPVFILGMMRSGSTLVEQILASHPRVFAAGERRDLDAAYRAVRPTLASTASYPETIPLLTGEQLRQLGDGYLARLGAAAAGAAADRITDKMPGNFSAIGLIRLALPNARIIHTVRDPIDTCLSCFSKLFSDDQPFAYDLGELGRCYRAYQALMEHWHAILPKDAVLDVRYEDLVADFERQARRIVGYCGLEWNDACLAFHKTDRPVRTASQVQVRQPLYQSSVGRWRPDAEILRPLLDGLGIDALGIGETPGVTGRSGHAGIGER